MRPMNLLEVCEHWMLSPETEFMNSKGDTYFMNKYGLIENVKGDTLKRYDMMKREWVMV